MLLRTATCCCGKISIDVQGDPDIHLVCHCNNCKQRTGSAFGISAYFVNTKIKNKNGDANIYKINNESTEQKRFFCPSCGTTLYWNISRFDGIPSVSEMTGVAGGCFIHNPLPDPIIMSYTTGKCAWLELPNMKNVGPTK